MKTVCVDLDGVLATYNGWEGESDIGDPISGAVRFMSALSDFCNVVVHTARSNKAPVIEWLDRHAFEYHSVWDQPGKPIASAYVDDRAVVCRPGKDIENQDFDTSLRICRALVSGHELGSQGTHSQGKLNEDDEGDLKMMISRADGMVRIDFGKPVGWLGLPKNEAVAFASLILRHADKL